MFVSTDYLAIQYGVDNSIAKFFVDREPPANNLYWHEKLLYLRFQPGYLFIPLIIDLLYKLGVAKADLLDENFVRHLEAIGHISALEEKEKMGYKDAVEACARLIRPVSKNDIYLQQLMAYLLGEENNSFQHLTTGINALHRGDLFLFLLAMLPGQHDYEKYVSYWFALISSLLLLDDAEDVQDDMKTNEANAFIECGLNETGMRKIELLIQKNIILVGSVNITLANKIQSQLNTIYNKPYFQQLK